MSKKIYAENAKWHLIITIAQYNSGLIDRQEYEKRLETLRRLTYSNSEIHKSLHELEELQQGEAVINDENSDIHIEIPSGRTLLFLQRNLRICDQDPLPSFPHIHDEELNCKVNLYTGYCDNGKRVSMNYLANVWNDPEFIKKIKKNIYTIMLKQRRH